MHSSGIHSPSRITKCSFIVHIDLVNSWSLPLWIANPLGPEIMFVGAMEMQQQPSLSIMTVMSQNSTVPFLVLKFSWNRCWVYVLVSCYYFLHLFVTWWWTERTHFLWHVILYTENESNIYKAEKFLRLVHWVI